MLTTSAFLGTRRSSSRSPGTDPRFPVSPGASVCQTFMAFQRSWSSQPSRRDSFSPRSAAPERLLLRHQEFSASIMTRNSIKRPISSISLGRGPWIGFNWRYDSGLVAGAVPFALDPTTPVDLTGLTADQQMQAGLFCGNVFPTLTTPLTTCAPSQYGSTRVTIPAPGTENDDHNPPRIASRHLFDIAVGDDNIFRGDKYKWSLRLTAINVTNKVALYNFLSTFSGTHFLTPRTYTVELGFHF